MPPLYAVMNTCAAQGSERDPRGIHLRAYPGQYEIVAPATALVEDEPVVVCSGGEHQASCRQAVVEVGRLEGPASICKAIVSSKPGPQDGDDGAGHVLKARDSDPAGAQEVL